MSRLLIKGGRIVTAVDDYMGDVLVEGLRDRDHRRPGADARHQPGQRLHLVVAAGIEAAGLTADKEILVYCGTSREGSLLLFYLKHVAGYPNVRLYEGAWKEYVWLKDKSLPAETGGEPAGK